jgi:PAS domain S-box-containing protein
VSPSGCRDLLDLVGRFQPMIMAAAEGVCVLSPMCELVFASPRLEDMLGLSAERLLAGTMSDLVHSDDRQLFSDMVSGLSSTSARRFRCRLVRFDGACLPVEVSLLPLVDGGVESLGLLAMFTDVSAEVCLQDALSSAEERIKLANLVGSLGHFDWDMKTDRVLWSEEIPGLFGAQAGDLKCSMQDLIARTLPDDRERLQLALAAVSGADIDQEVRVCHADQSVHWLRLRGHITQGVDGNAVRMLGILRDTTERNLGQADRLEALTSERQERDKAEHALLRLSSLQELTAALCDARTRHDVAEVVLQRAVPLFGAAAGSIGAYESETESLRLLWSVGYTDEFMASHQNYPANEDSLGGLVVTGRSPVFLEFIPEAQNLSPALRERLRQNGFLAAVAVPLVFEESVLGFLAFNYYHRQTFLPEERSLLGAFANQCTHALVRLGAYESELRARTAAEEALRQRELFLSAAAHELKTPLTSLRGFTQLITRRLNRGDTPTAAELNRSLQVIDRQAAKLNSLVDQILDVSRLESGRLALQFEQVDLVDLTRGIVSTMDYRTERGSVVINAPDELLATVDPDRLEQVLVNLLSNAQKYNQQDRPVEVDVHQAGSEAVICVRDFGPGFKPELLEGLVHPFHQSWTGDHLNGLGLGLYISREIINRHGGTLTAQCPSDGGALLVIRLPIEREPGRRTDNLAPADILTDRTLVPPADSAEPGGQPLRPRA